MSEVTETALIPLDKIAQIEAIKTKCDQLKKTIVLQIKTEDQYLSAMETERILDSDFKAVEQVRSEANEPYAKATREIGDQCNPIKAAVKGLLDQFSGACIKYQNDQAEKGRLEQERLNRIAAEERRKAEEKARVAREEEDRLRREAEQANNEAERQRLLKLAEQNAAKAQKAESKAETIIAPIAQTQAPAVKGMFTNGTPQFECTDVVKFVMHCVDTKQYHLLTFNKPACKAQAEAYGKETFVPGGRFYIGQSIVSNGRRF
jgi:hypothetical protein